MEPLLGEGGAPKFPSLGGGKAPKPPQKWDKTAPNQHWGRGKRLSPALPPPFWCSGGVN